MLSLNVAQYIDRSAEYQTVLNCASSIFEISWFRHFVHRGSLLVKIISDG